MHVEPYQVRELSVDEVLPLRTRVLRPHYEAGKLAHFEGDDTPQARHFGVCDAEDAVVAVATFMRRAAPFADDGQAVQLRGMAVAPELCGQGLGRRLLDASLPRVALAFSDASIVWCNARTSARAFYEKMGFATHGDIFVIDPIGPHVVMWRDLPALHAR